MHSGDAAVSIRLTTSIPASYMSRCLAKHVGGAVAWVVSGRDRGCWLSLTTGVHSTDSGGTRILGQASLCTAAAPEVLL